MQIPTFPISWVAQSDVAFTVNPGFWWGKGDPLA